MDEDDLAMNEWLIRMMDSHAGGGRGDGGDGGEIGSDRDERTATVSSEAWQDVWICRAGWVGHERVTNGMLGRG